MYLVVRGYCKAVYQTTLVQFNRPKMEKSLRFCNSKERYGELGVLEQQLKCVNPDFAIKAVRSDLRQQLRRLKPGYLPKVKLVLKSESDDKQSFEISNLVDQNAQELSKIKTTDNFVITEQSDEENTQVRETELTAESDDSGEITNRSIKLNDMTTLYGGERLIEKSFQFIAPKVRTTQNTSLDPNKPTELPHNHQPDIKVFTIKSKLAKQDLKTAKVDFIEHTASIGEGKTFCSRALLDKQRCIK